MEEYLYKGNSLRYLKSGSGRPMIMLHNGGAFHGIWKFQIEKFKNNFSIYAIDLLNFGESDYCSNSNSINDHLQVLESFISDHKLERPILMGTCIGASLSLLYAQKHPDKVETLILFNLCPGIKLLRNPMAKSWYNLTKSSSLAKRINNHLSMKVMNSRLEFKRLPGLLFGRHFDTNDSTFLKLQSYYRTPKQRNARLDLFNNIDSYTIPRFISKKTRLPPIQIFWGEYNKIVPLEIGYELRDLLRPKEFHSFKDAGHLMMLERPGRINQLISQFLKVS